MANAIIETINRTRLVNLMCFNPNRVACTTHRAANTTTPALVQMIAPGPPLIKNLPNGFVSVAPWARLKAVEARSAACETANSIRNLMQ